MLMSFKNVIQKDLSINGEYYVSLAYKYFFKKKKNILIYPIQHFSQWGTPQDFETYQSGQKLLKILKINISQIENSILTS